MKKTVLALAMMTATVTAFGPGVSSAGIFTKDKSVAETVERSKEGGWIVRNVWSDKSLGTCGAGCDRPEDGYAALCLGPAYKKATTEEKKRIQALLSSKYDIVKVARVRTFLVRHAAPIAPKGMAKVGDEVVFKTASHDEIFRGVNCSNQEIKDKGGLVVDRIVKHHDESILYANGKFLSSTPGNGEKPKEEAKPEPKGNPALDL